jgi:hypothetical protein
MGTVTGMSAFRWRYEAGDGSPVHTADLPEGAFPSQADAESWVGETWRELLAAGVDQVSLLRDGELVYGPMSLRPLE